MRLLWSQVCQTRPGTASRTAWALLGLIAIGDADSLSLQKGISYLVENQRQDGSWREDAYSGTGFPRTFYLRYELYRTYLPLLALGQYKNRLPRP